MGYREALEAAGATVHEYEAFGSYQGRWLAKVTLPDDGGEGWISGYYGSCTGCDAYQAEVEGVVPWDHKHDGKYVWDGEVVEHAGTCAVCAAAVVKLAEFGRGYFGGLQSTQEILANLEKDADKGWYDTDDRESAAYIRRVEGLT